MGRNNMKLVISQAKDRSLVRSTELRRRLDKRLEHGLEIEQVETLGSEDTLDSIQTRKIDIAVIKGGIRLEGRNHVVQVTALDIEPFHLLVKAKTYQDKNTGKPPLQPTDHPQ